MRHSGRQLGGKPYMLGRQVQTALLSMVRHSALGPQGDGTHGVIDGFCLTVKKHLFVNIFLF